MKKSLLILSFCILSLSVNAQNNSKTEKIKQLLELTGSGKMGIQVMNQMMDSFQKSFTNVPQEFWDECKKEMKSEDISNMIIPIYEKYYTETDINQLITFYNSPIGKKMIATMPQITQESMTAGQAWGKQIGQRVLAQLKEKGYLKK